jgi:recombination protein RecA
MEAATSVIKEFSEIENIKSVKDDLASDVNYLYAFGCPVIDIPFGGGIPSGKILEEYGWESAGKSTLALEIAKAFELFWRANGERLKKKHVIVWIEAEGALDKVRAKYMGCNAEDWMIYESRDMQDDRDFIMSILQKCQEKNIVALIVWDTIAATPTKEEKEEDGGRMANKASLCRSMLRKFMPMLGQTDSTLILVNQLSQNFVQNAPDETPMPAIKFYASIRCRVSLREKTPYISPSGDEIIKSIVSELKFDKNKLIQRGQKAMVVIDNEKGIDFLETSMRYLKKAKLANVKGAGWTELNLPERLHNKTNKDPIQMVTVKWQTAEKFRELCEVQYPHLKDWVDYLIYLNYTTVSPLVKVKIIPRVWEYEMKFFGEKRCQLTEEERRCADMLQAEDSKEEAKMGDHDEVPEGKVQRKGKKS